MILRGQHLRHQVIWIPNGCWKRQERTTNQKKEMLPDFRPNLFAKTVNLMRIEIIMEELLTLSSIIIGVSEGTRKG